MSFTAILPNSGEVETRRLSGLKSTRAQLYAWGKGSPTLRVRRLIKEIVVALGEYAARNSLFGENGTGLRLERAPKPGSGPIITSPLLVSRTRRPSGALRAR